MKIVEAAVSIQENKVDAVLTFSLKLNNVQHNYPKILHKGTLRLYLLSLGQTLSTFHYILLDKCRALLSVVERGVAKCSRHFT